MKKLSLCGAAVGLSAGFLLSFCCLPAIAADGPGTARSGAQEQNGPGQNQAQGMSLNVRAYTASRVWASLSNFALWQNVPDLDAESAYKAYLDKALASPDRAAFNRASMEFLAKFHNAHTLFGDMQLIQQGGSLPFKAEWIKGQWVVTTSAVAGLKPGDVIQGIDGRAFEEFYQEARPLISASTEAGARQDLFLREPGFSPYALLFPQQFTLALADGRKVAIDRRGAQLAPMTVEGHWLKEGKVAYIRIPSLFDPSFEKRAVELAKEYRQAAVLIVDMRGEPGGNTPGELTAFLMDRPYRWWNEAAPVSIPYFRARAEQGHWDLHPFNRPELSWTGPLQQPAKDHFAGKVVLLVDAGCYSSCEDFAMPFKDTHRGLIVGQTTGGSSGQPAMQDLGQGMMVMVGALHLTFPDGSKFEGVGIQPDVEATPTAEDLRAGKDAVLAAALRAAAQ